MITFCSLVLIPNSTWRCSLEKSLEQCLQCQDTMSLYRHALKMTLNSLNSDREQHIMREVTKTLFLTPVMRAYCALALCFHGVSVVPQILCLVCASHNGVSESEVLDLFPEVKLPVLSSLLHRLNRLCIVTVRCGLIRFQHLQVTSR